MGDLLQTSTSAAVAVVVAALCVLVGLALRSRRRAADARRSAELAGSRAQVEQLTRRVEELALQVDSVRQVRADDRHLEREFVITSLAQVGSSTAEAAPAERLPAERLPARRDARRTVADTVEQQLVETLVRHRRSHGWRAAAVDAAVRTVALGHGLRGALRPEVLDRAAAESQVARRRSRRERRRELREAQRLVRAVKSGRVIARDVA